MIMQRSAILICMLAFPFLLNGQDEGFKASAPATVRVGEQFQYVIEGSRQGDVILPDMKEFRLMAGPFSSYSSHSSWVNGKMTRETVVTYTHVLQASQEGELTIAPATVRVGRKEYKTNELKVRVLASNAQQPQGNAGTGNSGGNAGAGTSQGNAGAENASGGSNEPVFLRILPSKREVYLGEQLVSGLKVYTRVQTRPAGGSGDLPYEGFYKTSIDPDATASRQVIGGQEYVSQVIQRHILIPQKTGDVVIAPYESEWMVQQRVQRRSNSPFDSFFDDPFFSGVQEVPTNLATLPVTIRVKPLPMGAPEGFTGGVGSFNMKAELTTDKVKVNEALSLKITISGSGNLPLLGEPEIHMPPDHDVYDVNRKLNTSTGNMRISGTVTFEYPIVARHAGKFRIAPIRFSWFDPEKKEYLTATSEEFLFTVERGEGGEEGPNGTVLIPGLKGETVRDLGTDIRDISRIQGSLHPLGFSLMGQAWYRLLYPLLILIMVLIVVLLSVITRRNADLRLVKNRKASKTARTRLKKAEKMLKGGSEEAFYEEIGKAIWGYLGDKLGVETVGLNREGIADLLRERGVDETLLDEYHRILEESEFSRFAPSAEKSDRSSLYNDAAQMIRNLESKL